MAYRQIPWTHPENRYFSRWSKNLWPPRTDDAIEHDVVDALMSSPYEPAYEIEVTVIHGVVVLAGTATASVAKTAAADEAWATLGVRDVSNQLVVAAP